MSSFIYFGSDRWVCFQRIFSKVYSTLLHYKIEEKQLSLELMLPTHFELMNTVYCSQEVEQEQFILFHDFEFILGLLNHSKSRDKDRCLKLMYTGTDFCCCYSQKGFLTSFENSWQRCFIESCSALACMYSLKTLAFKSPIQAKDQASDSFHENHLASKTCSHPCS